MNRQTIFELIEALEADHDHLLSLEQWAELLWSLDAAYHDRPRPKAMRFRTRTHRLRVYARRVASGLSPFAATAEFTDHDHVKLRFHK